jgi:hypothetical protein
MIEPAKRNIRITATRPIPSEFSTHNSHGRRLGARGSLVGLVEDGARRFRGKHLAGLES